MNKNSLYSLMPYRKAKCAAYWEVEKRNSQHFHLWIVEMRHNFLGSDHSRISSSICCKPRNALIWVFIGTNTNICKQNTQPKDQHWLCVFLNNANYIALKTGWNAATARTRHCGRKERKRREGTLKDKEKERAAVHPPRLRWSVGIQQVLRLCSKGITHITGFMSEKLVSVSHSGPPCAEKDNRIIGGGRRLVTVSL